MASLTLTIGAEGTDQEKLNAVCLALTRHMREEGKRHRRNVATYEMTIAIQAEIDGLSWE